MLSEKYQARLDAFRKNPTREPQKPIPTQPSFNPRKDANLDYESEKEFYNRSKK